MTDTNFISNLNTILSMPKEELNRKLEQENIIINGQVDPFPINLLTGLIVEPMCDKAKELLNLSDLHTYFIIYK